MNRLTRMTVMSALATAAMLATATAAADEAELKNDGFTDGGQASCQQGFVTGDEGAVTLGPAAGTYQLMAVTFLFCGADTQQTVTARVYRELGTAAPGALLYEGDFQITGSVDMINEIDLSTENLVFASDEPFRFSIRLQHDGPPGIARDDDGVSMPKVNWIYDAATSTWGEASSFGVNGDWIIRATVDVMAGGQGGSSSGGSGGAGGADPSGGSGGAGGAGEDGGDDSSCDCRVGVGAPDTGSASGAAWLLWMAAGACARRRRRTR